MIPINIWDSSFSPSATSQHSIHWSVVLRKKGVIKAHTATMQSAHLLSRVDRWLNCHLWQFKIWKSFGLLQVKTEGGIGVLWPRFRQMTQTKWSEQKWEEQPDQKPSNTCFQRRDNLPLNLRTADLPSNPSDSIIFFLGCCASETGGGSSVWRYLCQCGTSRPHSGEVSFT